MVHDAPLIKEERLSPDNFRFVEFFAGTGNLTAAVAKAGVPTDPPDDLLTGGLDFGKTEDIEQMKAYLAGLSSSGVKLMVHLAPPCATFSRARDRSWKTRLRSTLRPQGLLGKGSQCKEANVVARNALNLLEYAVTELGAAASMENPRSSYLWSFLDFDPEIPFADFVFSPCRFGATYMSSHRLR